MDEESKHAVMFVQALASNRNSLGEFGQRLRLRPEVGRVLISLEPRQYESRFVIEGYVDAELNNGKALSWWLEIHWEETGWRIEARVLVNHNEGQDTVREFPERKAGTLAQCVAQLTAAVNNLTGDESWVALTQ